MKVKRCKKCGTMKNIKGNKDICKRCEEEDIDEIFDDDLNHEIIISN